MKDTGSSFKATEQPYMMQRWLDERRWEEPFHAISQVIGVERASEDT